MFELSQKGTLTGVLVKRGSTDDSPVLVDIRILVEGTPSTSVAALLGVEKVAQLEDALFHSTGPGRAREPILLGVDEIRSSAKFEARHLLKLGGQKPQRCVRVSKFAIVPRGAAKFDVSFSVVIEVPPNGFVEFVGEKLHREVSVKLTQDAELPLKMPKDKPAATDQPELPLKKPTRAQEREARRQLRAVEKEMKAPAKRKSVKAAAKDSAAPKRTDSLEESAS